MSWVLQLSREIALRIGLAARALPGVSVGALVNGLVSQVGWPLTEEKLARLTVTHLRNALSQGGSIDADADAPVADVVENYGVALLKEVVEILWGEKHEEEALPAVEPYSEGDIPDSIRVAVASDSDENLDAHFGSCRRYLIYQVGVAECRLVAIRSSAGADEAEDSSAFRAELIRDCHVLFVQSIGGPAAAKVINTGIYPLKFAEGGAGPRASRRAAAEDGIACRRPGSPRR